MDVCASEFRENVTCKTAIFQKETRLMIIMLYFITCVHISSQTCYVLYFFFFLNPPGNMTVTGKSILLNLIKTLCELIITLIH